MKKALLLLFVALFVQTANATIYMVDNNPGSQFPISSVQDALDNYADTTGGDTIMVIGSTTSYGSITINFPVALIGEGVYSLGGDTVRFNRILVRSSDVTISGVIAAIDLEAFNNPFNEIKNVVIERCGLRRGTANGFVLSFLGLDGGPGSSGHGLFQNIIVRNNVVFSGTIKLNETDNSFSKHRAAFDTIKIENNIIAQGYFERYPSVQSTNAVLGETSIFIRNNTFINGEWNNAHSVFCEQSSQTNGRYARNINVENNIFYQANPAKCDSCNYRNNLTYGNGVYDTIYTAGIDTGNIIANATDTIFINYPGGTFSFNQNFNLASGSPAINAGSDTTNIGTTGGDFPFVVGEGPKVPLVDYVNISSSTTQQPSQYFLQFDAQTRTDVYYTGTHITNNDSVPITHAEYWIDAIPIPGTGTVISCNNPADTIFYNDSIPGLVLDTGTHVVSVRARNSLGNWGFIKTDTIRNEYYDVDFIVSHPPFIRPNRKTKFKITFKNRSSVDIVEKYLVMKFPKDFQVEFENLGDSINGVDISNVSKTIFVDGDNPHYVMPMWVGKLPKYQTISYDMYVTFPALARVDKYITFDLLGTVESDMQEYFNLFSFDNSFLKSHYANSLINSFYIVRDTIDLDTLSYSTVKDSLDSWFSNNHNLYYNLLPLNIIPKTFLNQNFNTSLSDTIYNLVNRVVNNAFNFSTYNMGPARLDTVGLFNFNRILQNPDCNCPILITPTSPPCDPLQNPNLFKLSSGCRKRCKCECKWVGDQFRWKRNQEKTHMALDIDINENAPLIKHQEWFDCGVIVRSMYSGIAFLYDDEHGGKHVRVESIDAVGDTFNIFYVHLCEEGRITGYVNACDPIGFVGATGDATGIHLHIDADQLPLSCFNGVEEIFQPSNAGVLEDVMCKEPQTNKCKEKEKEGNCNPYTQDDFYSASGVCYPEGLDKDKCNEITPIGASDPNDKVGNEGYAAPRYIKHTDELHYGIFFENVDSATAPAQVVHIIDTLDLTKVDASTFYFESITAGEMLIVLLDSVHIQNLDTTFMEEPINGCFVRAQASFNSTTGVIDFLLTSLDTIFLSPDSVGVTEGFLPPDTTNFHGNGLVSFKVMPVSTIPDDMVIYNTAQIIFDSNPPIQTGTWFNTIDRIEPISNVITLPACTYDTSIVVSWTGTDDGAGIVAYDIYAKASGDTAFTKWLSYTTLTTDTFPGVLDSTYQFYSIAYDSVGNMENKQPLIEASTTVCPVGINYIYNSSDLKIYPNPTSGKLIIESELEKNGKLNVEIYNLLNQKLLSFDGDDSSNKHFKKEIDVRNQTDGVYLLRLNFSGQSVTRKFILKNK